MPMSNATSLRSPPASTRPLATLKSSGAQELPESIIHSDYHPGNLKFVGDEVSGLVDFDWAKLDLRAFDVGLALWYFCASWEAGSDGALRLDDLTAFVSSYQGALEGEGQPGPLSARELALLPDLIQAGNVYILYWTIRDYYGRPSTRPSSSSTSNTTFTPAGGFAHLTTGASSKRRSRRPAGGRTGDDPTMPVGSDHRDAGSGNRTCSLTRPMRHPAKGSGRPTGIMRISSCPIRGGQRCRTPLAASCRSLSRST